MNTKRLVLATAMMTALGGMYGCSEGDEAVINIDAPTENNTTNNAGGDTGGGDSGISTNCPSWAGAKQRDGDGNDVCALPAQITQNRTLTNDIVWLMEGRVTVGNGNQEMSVTPQGSAAGELANGKPLLNVTLTIQEGTEIKGVTGTFANLIITRGSKIQAVGTADEPIVFSSDDPGYTGSGEWGGLVMHGFGLHNECTDPCNIDSEGESGFGGGFFKEDDSGTLSYVLVTEGGFEFAVGNEINGISLIGVGSGTTINHIQVNDNSDDGIEFYGGDVNVKYMVLTGNLDDSIDWDEGYQGNIQYVIVRQTPSVTGNVIEADTQGAPTPLSKPTIANATFVADGDEPNLLEFKAGTGVFLHNTAMVVAAGNTTLTECLQVNGADAQANRNTSLVINNMVAQCTAGGDGVFGDSVLDQTTVTFADPQIDSIYAAQAPEAQLGAPLDWAAINATFPESVADESFLDATDYIGGVNPDGSDPWWAGWVFEGSL